MTQFDDDKTMRVKIYSESHQLLRILNHTDDGWGSNEREIHSESKFDNERETNRINNHEKINNETPTSLIDLTNRTRHSEKQKMRGKVHSFI